MLKDLTNEKLVCLNIEARDWKEAIYKSAEPLLLAGKIKKSYIEAIINTIEETGPYIVITKNVALPHARAEYGAIESAIGIATLKKPVCFGSEENDPVKYIFCLSAHDNTSHLMALADLTALLERKDFYKMLDQAQSASEIISYINNL
ncbi:PTS sugar transporter subunit IIA [Pectinatus cerevisiiphilus]|uniref:Ascorbate-specific PTS system EIIA component n=1 Tax=Pectinatus cerevisiiphilus TaxID=86956 RepID=A0A4R3KH16_9FIRM|nr:PTS sugar transporter subunit IIA [Pectinatus cerevisiiphilus]TCS81961.1 PTS system ascorbate-specific IIA component [Pectinatus cerevisiiphilus]